METTTDRPGPITGIGTPTEIESGLEEAFDQLVPIRDVHDPEILRDLAKHLARHVAIENQAVLLECNHDGTYVLGMSDPLNAVNLRNVVRVLGISSSRVRPRLVIPQRLAMLHEIAYEDRGDELAKPEPDRHRRDSAHETIDWNTLDSNAGRTTADADSSEPDVEIGLGTGFRATAEQVLLEGIKRRASDIHVIPGDGAGRISMRTDGVVHTPITKIPAARMENLANAFSDMAGVNGYELMQQSKGAEINITLRTNTGERQRRTLRFEGARSYYGRAIVIRIQESVFRNFDQIGIEQSQQEIIQQALDYRNGVILVTGATGSGKSNTLEAMLRRLEHTYQYHKHIIQIGNPIEFPNDRRTQLRVDDNESWGAALKHSMRMDPDVFSPLEFRDANEAAIVFEGAATGHLTLTTVHTNNVAQTFSRLDFLKIGRDKQADLIRLLVSQELVPLLCKNCREPDPRGREIAERLVEVVFPNRPELKTAIATAQGMTPFFRADGCAACNNLGLKGRTCIAEMLHITPDISRMLRKGTEGEEIVDYAVRNHAMITLAEAAARKLCRGMISYDRVKHLLSTHQAAPETETHAWQTSDDDGSARQPETFVGDFIDVEFNVPPQAHAHSQHATASGFSMIELLIVVAIVAIISAIAIPSFIASRRAGYENTAKQKLAAVAQQQTAFKTLLGKRRYGTIAELQAAIAGGSPLLTTSDTNVTGWTFTDEGTASSTTFGAKVTPAQGNPATYSFYISEDQTLRRCALSGPWTKAACTAVDQ